MSVGTMSDVTTVSCAVADDHPAVLNAVSELLAEQGYEVVARAKDGRQAVAAIEEHQPQMALLDLRMPGMSGIEVARRVARSSPETKIMLYTGYGDRALLTEALDAGIRAFLLKEAPLADLIRAFEIVGEGGTYVDSVLAGVLASADAAGNLPSLTTREREILRLLADGKTNEEVGAALFISPETVRTHVRRAMKKLGADTRTEAVATALRQRLIA